MCNRNILPSGRTNSLQIYSESKRSGNFRPLDVSRVSNARKSTGELSLHDELSSFVNPEHSACNANKHHYIPQSQRLCLKYPLQKWEVNDTCLPSKATSYSIVKHLVPKKLQLSKQYRLRFRSTGQCIEHVEENKGSKSHGSIAPRDE